MPKDSRGWMVLEVAAQPESEPQKILKIEVRTERGHLKQLQLVCQTVKMRVYVNPEACASDEWEIPAESGQIFHVGSP